MINEIKKIYKILCRKLWTSIALRKVAVKNGVVRVNKKSKFNGNTFLGENANFNGMKILGKGKVVIGKNFHSGSECIILTQNHNYDQGNKIPYDDTYCVKEVSIGDNVWLGDRVIILGGVEIKEGAIIQAGSVVSSDIPECAIAGGNPARVFKYRDTEHYEKLKKEKSYY